MTLFQEGNTISNNKLIFPVALKTIIIKYNKYMHIHIFKQYIHIHNKLSQSEYNGYHVIIIRYLTTILPIFSSIVINAVSVTTRTFEP